MPTPLVITISGPSTAGKDTILQAVLARCPQLAKPVTTTTRPPRPGEVDGTHYHFLGWTGETTPATQAERNVQFAAAEAEGRFLETNAYGAARYGLSRQALHDVQAAGRVPVVILDVNGVAAIRDQFPIHRIFVRAPRDQIVARLAATRAADEIAGRMAEVDRELAIGATYDTVIENPDGALEAAIEATLAAITQQVAIAQAPARSTVARAR